MGKYLLFTFLRYIEFGLFSLMVFVLASRISSAEYGMASSSFILITLSAFVVLGGNQVLVKWYSKENILEKKDNLILYSLGTNLLASIVAFFILINIATTEYSFNVGIIGAGKILIEGIATINRINDKFNRVNLVYLSNIVPFFTFFFMMEIDNTVEFFTYWSITILVAVIIGFASIYKIIRTSVVLLYSKKFNYIKLNFKAIFTDGLKLALIGFLAPFIGSIDKLLLSYTTFDKSLLGSMQLADNIASAIALGVGSLVFMITPKYIKMLNEKKITVNTVNRYGYRYLFFAILFLITIIFFSKDLLSLFFPNYSLTYPLIMQVITRLLITGLFMFNVIAMAFSKENFYIKILFYIFPFHLFSLLIFLQLFNDQTLFYFLPWISIFSLMGIHISTYAYSRNIQC